MMDDDDDDDDDDDGADDDGDNGVEVTCSECEWFWMVPWTPEKGDDIKTCMASFWCL